MSKFLRRIQPIVALAMSLTLVAAALSQSASRRAAARRDAQHPAAPSIPQFTDVTRASGIDFQLTCGSRDKHYIMETMCGGVAVLDYDNDGWMDLFFVNGSTLEDLPAGKCHSAKLYRNNHDGTFTDVTAKAGLTSCDWGFGVAVGDYDNDGWDDLYVTTLQGGRLYHNNRDGTFTDVTEKSGAANAGRWGTSAAFGDYDNDGYLDLYIANYIDLDLENLQEFGSGPNCTYRGIQVSCGPRGLKGARDRLYHNNGDGTFTDVTEKLGIDPDGSYGLGVLWLDYDKDGCLDLYVADDSSPSLLYHNNCKGGFEEVGIATGVAYSSDGREQAGMGIDTADYDHDGWPDIAKTNFSDDSNNLYHNDGKSGFTDLAGASGFGPVSVPFLGFGVKFFDFNNDGWEDVFVANGHVNPQVDQHSFGVSYAERPFLFRNDGNGKFEEIGQKSGEALRRRYVGRGLAVADFLNRGTLDVILTQDDGSPVLLRDTQPSSNHWLRIKLVGKTSNRDGLGARVEVVAGALHQEQEARANSSFESASDRRLHFGLGSATRVRSISVRWPSGKESELNNVSVDQEVIIEEPPSPKAPAE